MARLFLTLVVLAVVSVIGLSGPASTAPAQAPDPARLRVLTWNIQKGLDSSGDYDLERTIATIAALQPDIVGLQEVMRNHAGFRCDDQPALLAKGLQRVTRRPWVQTHRREWVTKKRACVESGRGDGVETEGLVLLAPEPFAETEFVQLWNGRIGLMARLTSRPDVAVIVTHLAASRRNQDDRIRQLGKLLPWGAGRGGTRILMGDFNAASDAEEMKPVFADYKDAWTEASARGTATGGDSTRAGGRGGRIDYVFYTGPRLELESLEVVDTSTALARSEASDHRPVLATFRLGK